MFSSNKRMCKKLNNIGNHKALLVPDSCGASGKKRQQYQDCFCSFH